MPNENDIILKGLFEVSSINENNGLSFKGMRECGTYIKFLTLLKLVSLEENQIQTKLECMRYYFYPFAYKYGVISGGQPATVQRRTKPFKWYSVKNSATCFSVIVIIL
jgi:hypothetical protein